MQETEEMPVRSLGWEDPLEKGMATHCGILAWRIPWTEEPGGLQSIGLQRIGHDWSDLAYTHKFLDKYEVCNRSQGAAHPATKRSIFLHYRPRHELHLGLFQQEMHFSTEKGVQSIWHFWCIWPTGEVPSNFTLKWAGCIEFLPEASPKYSTEPVLSGKRQWTPWSFKWCTEKK